MEAGRWRCQMLQFYIWIISVCVGSRGKVQRVTERTRLLETMNIQLPLHWVSAGRSGSVGPHRSGSDRTGGTGCTAAAAAAVMIASCSDGGAAVLWSEVCFLPRRGGETSREALRLHPGSSHCQPPLASLPDQLQSWGHLCLKSLGALKLWRGAATKVHSPVKQTPLANSALISTFVIGARRFARRRADNDRDCENTPTSCESRMNLQSVCRRFKESGNNHGNSSVRFKNQQTGTQLHLHTLILLQATDCLIYFWIVKLDWNMYVCVIKPENIWSTLSEIGKQNKWRESNWCNELKHSKISMYWYLNTIHQMTDVTEARHFEQ